MPGFGQSPLGQEQAGRWKWSRQVLFDLLPEVYKQTDRDVEGQPLETYTEALRPSFDNVLERIRAFTDLRDPVKARTEFTEETVIRLGAEVPTLGSIEQVGLDGTVNLVRYFSAPSARFEPTDLGKQLTIFNSNFAANNRSVVIASIVLYRG
jgi:hypothetical protein